MSYPARWICCCDRRMAWNDGLPCARFAQARHLWIAVHVQDCQQGQYSCIKKKKKTVSSDEPRCQVNEPSTPQPTTKPYINTYIITFCNCLIKKSSLSFKKVLVSEHCRICSRSASGDSFSKSTRSFSEGIFFFFFWVCLFVVCLFVCIKKKKGFFQGAETVSLGCFFFFFRANKHL